MLQWQAACRGCSSALHHGACCRPLPPAPPQLHSQQRRTPQPPPTIMVILAPPAPLQDLPGLQPGLCSVGPSPHPTPCPPTPSIPPHALACPSPSPTSCPGLSPGLCRSSGSGSSGWGSVTVPARGAAAASGVGGGATDAPRQGGWQTPPSTPASTPTSTEVQPHLHRPLGNHPGQPSSLLQTPAQSPHPHPPPPRTHTPGFSRKVTNARALAAQASSGGPRCARCLRPSNSGWGCPLAALFITSTRTCPCSRSAGGGWVGVVWMWGRPRGVLGGGWVGGTEVRGAWFAPIPTGTARCLCVLCRWQPQDPF